MEQDETHTDRPVPAPRGTHKPTSPTRALPGNRPPPIKPPIASKPKIVSKPSVPAKASHEDDGQRMSRTSRPLSVKVTDDGVHNKVASELAAILGRPKSGSKGLLSPVSYGEHTDGVTAHQPEQSSPPMKNVGVVKPVPRARRLSSPSSPSYTTSTPAGHSPTSATSTTVEHASAASTTVDHVPLPAKSTTVEHAAASATSTTVENAPEPSQPADKSNEGVVKKVKPARPPPPSVKKPPPPVVKRPPSHKPPESESNGGESKGPEQAHHPQPIKKKLEITVLGAKPMAEVGFRDVQGVAKMPAKVAAEDVPTSHSGQSDSQKAGSTAHKAPCGEAVMKTRGDNPKSVAAPSGEASSHNPSNRKPTVIRPPRKPMTKEHVEADSLVPKNTGPSNEHKENKSEPSTQRPVNSPQLQKKPPHSLPVKKDPWSQIAKGPGPTDNLAFSTGDTPPSKSHSLSFMQTISNQDVDANITSQPDSSSQSTNHTGASRSMAAISESAKSPVEGASMFFQSMSADSTPISSKPSALQRIYEAKREREESQPNKYKHRADCYIDKPNVDTNFWKPGPDSFEVKGKAENKQSKKNVGGAPLVAYAAFAYRAKQPNDLSLMAGEEVKVLARIDQEWLYGEAGGRLGEFPSLYVTVSDEEIQALPLHTPIRGEQPSATAPSGQATAMFDFTAEHQTELSLKAGEVIEGVEPVDTEWSFGRIAGRSGIFPTAFVKLTRR